MKVMFLNNDGGGFADYVDVADGTPVENFFNDHKPIGASASRGCPGTRITWRVNSRQGAAELNLPHRN